MWKSYEVYNRISVDAFYSLFEVVRKDGYSFPGEAHDFWECVCVIEGQVTVSGDERVYELKTGGIAFHKPLELHKLHVENGKSAHLLVFSFSAHGEIIDFFRNKVFFMSQSQMDIVASLLEYVRSNCYDENAGNYLKCVKLFDTDKTYLETVSLYVSLLLLSLARSSEMSDCASTPNAVLFRKAVNVMKDNIRHVLTVDGIAAKCCVSKSVLKRVFTTYAGFGVHRYYLKLRLNKASEYLREGKNVTEAAYLTGFSSQSTFSSVFRRENGISPRSYRSEAFALPREAKDNSPIIIK